MEPLPVLRPFKCPIFCDFSKFLRWVHKQNKNIQVVSWRWKISSWVVTHCWMTFKLVTHFPFFFETRLLVFRFVCYPVLLQFELLLVCKSCYFLQDLKQHVLRCISQFILPTDFMSLKWKSRIRRWHEHAHLFPWVLSTTPQKAVNQSSRKRGQFIRIRSVLTTFTINKS